MCESSPRKQHHFNFWPHAKTAILNFGILWVFEFYSVRFGIVFGRVGMKPLQLDAMWFIQFIIFVLLKGLRVESIQSIVLRLAVASQLFKD